MQSGAEEKTSSEVAKTVCSSAPRRPLAWQTIGQLRLPGAAVAEQTNACVDFLLPLPKDDGGGSDDRC